MIDTGAIDGGPVISKLRQFSYLTGLSMAEQIRITARVLAVSLAHSTQPYGKTKAAHETGKRRVEADIRKVFATAGTLYDALEKKDSGAAAGFWKAWKARDESAMQEALRGTGMGGLPMIPSPDPGLHAARRGRGGRVKGKQVSAFVTNAAALKKYIAGVQKRVGLTKAGWARAAAMTGGTRGIPAWASTKQPLASGGADVNTNPKKPVIVIKNDTPWADEAIPEAEFTRAIDIAEEKLLKRMAIIVRKLTGRTDFA